MRYTRPALAITAALLALTGIGTTAHADNYGKDPGKSNICFIEVKGNHNHNACGNIKYGNNATTGNGHNIRSGQLGLRRPEPSGQWSHYGGTTRKGKSVVAETQEI
ncbi:hypothetical protein ACTVZO_43140 [Streptomyces sp. IBSNAI002]|uniref:hypothetical protein n=1 Tax=Streptomyces sp. IBSNAI002 TaxID=3457500 RepID=UPI003FD5EBE2